MADKISTIVLKVDLDCSKCYNKLRRTLCQNHYEIRSQVIDIKAKTITISGPFDPQKFAKKLNDKAGKVIKGIEIKQPPKKEEEKPKPKPADPKPEDKPKQADPKPADKPQGEKAAEKPKEAKSADPPKPQGEKAAEKPKEAKSADPPKQAAGSEPGPAMKLVEPGTVLAYPIVQPPYGMYSSVPVYEGYYGGGEPLLHDGYGRPISSYDHGYGGNRVYANGNNNNPNYGYDYFSEKDPTCNIM